VQLVFVFIAFAIIVIASYFLVGDIERKHLKNVTENAITYTEANIIADFLEPESTLSTIAETIRVMILNGSSFNMVTDYIDNITDYLLADDHLMSNATSVYGVFDAFGGKFWTGIDWTPTDDFVPVERPWYKTAVAANGKVGITEPYQDVSIGIILITYARRIFDEQGRPLGVVCLDISLDRIRDYADNTRVAEGSYGILIDSQFEVIAHPVPAYWGRSLRDMNDGVSIEYDLRHGTDISERKVKDYKGDSSILFVHRLQNGWYLGIMTPESAYNQSMKSVAHLLSMISLLMAITLSAGLIRLAAAKNKSDVESRQTGNFLATMSHEIRTPMNAILGITEMQMQNKALPQDASEAMTKIYNSGYSLLNVINDILDLSKLESGKLELSLVKYNVASLIHDTIQQNIMRIGSKEVRFELQVDSFVPAELIGDQLRVRQILNNLLSNAFKYTENGEVVLSVTAKYEDRVKSPHVSLIFQVRDTGRGMTKEQISRIFDDDEYSGFNQEANRETEGAGLSLTITKQLIRMMNGSISVKSETGKGSTFIIRLPQRNVGAAPLGEETAESLRQLRYKDIVQTETAQIMREPMPYGSVLIVDDVETNLYVAKGLLSPYGLTIDTAESGFEAIEKIKAGRLYDIVFMDHMMPKMDGIEATKIIRESGYTRPVIALTANAVAGQAEIFLSNGFNDFISKPIDIRHLNALLITLIRDKQSPDIIEAARKSAAMNKPVIDETPQSSVAPELARTFIRDAEKTIKVLEMVYSKHDTFDDEDIQLYVINVHAMKSALANIGETELSRFARKLEAAGKERDIAVISTETPDFLNELRTIIEKITPQEEDNNDKTTKEDQEFFEEKMIVFRAACTIYDKKAAKEVLVELKKKNWPRPIKDMLNTLAEHLLHSDFEEAANIARDYEFTE
jgi:signal transduction histidine kinase/CheY-like chemotaxis protein/HPt (histidine-containing phosphotransfer) domain-containing protein